MELNINELSFNKNTNNMLRLYDKHDDDGVMYNFGVCSCFSSKILQKLFLATMEKFLCFYGNTLLPCICKSLFFFVCWQLVEILEQYNNDTKIFHIESVCM